VTRSKAEDLTRLRHFAKPVPVNAQLSFQHSHAKTNRTAELCKRNRDDMFGRSAIAKSQCDFVLA